MNEKVVRVPLSAAGIGKAIKAVEDYQSWLKEKSTILLNRLTEEGLSITSARFSQAVYDGTNDVSVSVENRGERVRAVVAIGSSVLFIEFGTGVTYPDNHPEAATNGFSRGSYGKGHGKQASWGYYGEAGTNGIVKTKKNGQAVVITKGNPANMSMYETVKALKDRLPALVKEVFL